MKKAILTFFLISILIFLSACTSLNLVQDPTINLSFTVSNLTDKDFESVGTHGVDNATKNDFKKIKFDFDMVHSDKIKDKKITVPNFRNVANSYDKDRYWYGKSYIQDNSNESFANYSYDFVFLSRGLDDQTIKSIFDNCEVKVSWTNNSQYEEKVFKLVENR